MDPLLMVDDIPVTKIELSISCRNLADMDTFSKSDPMVVVYEMDDAIQKFREIGRTEMIWNTLNPNFVKKFVLDYHFEECQKMRFEVYDIDAVNANLSKQDFIGECTVTLGEIVASGFLEKELTKKGKGKRGRIRLKAEEESMCHDELVLEFAGKKLDRKDLFGLSDPFLAFSRVDEDGGRTVCHRTEVIKTTLSPHWKQFRIPLCRLCKGDIHRSIYVECFDWNKNGSHSFIGEFCTNVSELATWPKGNNEFPLIHPKKQQKKRSYKNSGTVHLLFCKREEMHSFVEYIQGDLELCCSIAIDFTKSNGDPKDPRSLHHLNSRMPTQYAIALEAVGEIIKDYDSDQQFPAFGFGARLPPSGEVSHDFPLNGNFHNPSCSGIPGVLAAYHHSLQSVQLYGPTNFAPSIYRVVAQARSIRDGSQYFILLILTDGVITDMPQTKEAIVQASTLPISIIIVGVGNADFEAMDVLDGDEVRVSSNGKLAARDIVQFVPFRDFVRNTQNLTVTKRALAKAVLEEIPDQLVSYMRDNNLKPRPLQRQPQPSVRHGQHRPFNGMNAPCLGAEAPPPYRR